MKKIFILFFAFLISVTMFAQEAVKTPAQGVTRSNTVRTAKNISESVVNDQNGGPSRAGQLLWMQEFESPTFPPANWTLYGTNFTRYSNYGRTNPACIGYDEGSNSFPTYGITTQAFTPVAGNVFSFWAMHDVTYTASSSYYTAYRIKVSTTNNAQASFTTVKEYSNYQYSGIHSNRVIYTSAQIGNWYEMTYDLSSYVGQQIYMAIEVYDHYGDDGITIDDVGLKLLNQNDIAIVPTAFPYTKIPQSQVAQMPFALTARAQNVGTAAQTGVYTTVTCNGTQLGGNSNTIATVAAGATSNAMTVNVPTGTFPSALGNKTVTYTVTQTQTDADPSDNTKNYSVEVTNMLYAADEYPDNITTYGVGVAALNSLIGNYFTITEPTVVDQVFVGFAMGAGTQAYKAELYRRTSATSTTFEPTPLFSVEGNRVPASWQTINIPRTAVAPGDYFLCLKALTADNIAVAYDNEPTRTCYYANPSTLTAASGFGSLALRMNCTTFTGVCNPATPTNLLVSNLGLTSATLSWEGTAPFYFKVTVNGTAYYTTNNTLTLTGLTEGTTYTWTVAAMCSATEGGDNATQKVFTTLRQECATKIVGTGTSTGYYPIPGYWGSVRSISLYEATEIGGADNITSLAFYISTANASLRPMKIYLMYALDNTHLLQNTYVWNTIKAQATLVYDASTACPATGWQTFNITPFAYNGTSDLLVLVEGTGTSTGGGATVQCRYSTKTSCFWYRGADTWDMTANDAASGGTRTNNRPNITFGLSCTQYYPLNPNNILGVGAEITTVGTYPVPSGGNLTFNFTCNDPCREITDVIIDGVSMGAITTYTFTNVTAILPVIEVKTDYIKYYITATTGPNGSIDFNPNDYITCQTGTMCRILPDAGFMISELRVDGVIVTTPINNAYNFLAGQVSHTIHVTFEPCPTFAINYIVEGPGVLAYQSFDYTGTGTLHICSGNRVDFDFVPDTGAEIQAIYIDGIQNILAAGTGHYIFANLLHNHNIRVVFKLQDIIINATAAGANGTITPAGNIPVPYGTDKTFTICGNPGYIIDQLFIDGNPVNVPAQTACYEYTFTNVIAPHTIYATFTRATYIITVTSCAGGTVDLEGAVPVLFNDIIKFTFYPETGYKVSQVLVDGVSYAPAVQTGSYTFYYVDAPHTLDVCFERYTYPITATFNANGYFTVGNAGTTNVPHGSNKLYKYVAMPGYKIDKVFIDGYSNPEAVAGEYTFTNVTGPHTINVTTAQLTYTITASATEGGYISPAGAVTVTYGQSKTFMINAAPGHEIEWVKIDGTINGGAAINGAYTFANVTENHTIEVSFKVIRYQMLSVANPNGSIEPAGITEINFGEDITYTITPAEGYQISYVLVNGDNMGEIDTYTFYAVEENGTVEAFFKVIPNDPTGIIDPTNAGVSIYSNNNKVYIVNENNLPISDVSIFDMYGRTVWQGALHTNPITLNVATGIYTVRVSTDEGFTTTKVSILK